MLNFHPELAPIKIAVLPLLKKNSGIVETANSSRADLRKRWYSVYDDTASIGRLYRRQDEVGTPFCVTVDVQTVGDEKAARRRESDDSRPQHHGAGARGDERACGGDGQDSWPGNGRKFTPNTAFQRI